MSWVSYFPILYLIKVTKPPSCLPTSHSLSSPVPVPPPPFLLDRTRPDLLPEDNQKRFVQDVQGLQAAEVAKQLEDFRWRSHILRAIQHVS